ncbi:MAG: YdeI/OmpD-associated family protein [Cyclobacteriaceae bacterium]
MAKGDPKVFRFSTRLETFHRSFTHTAIIVPDEVMAQLPPKGIIRTKGTFNKTPFALAIQHRKDGARFFMVSAQLRREAMIQSGDPVNVEFWQVDSNLVDVPEELQAVIDQDEEAEKLWKTFTPATQRGLSHYVNSVKNVDSRIKRALEIVEKVKYKQLHFQKMKKDKRK